MTFRHVLSGVGVAAIVGATLVTASAPAAAATPTPGALPITYPISSLVDAPASYPSQPALAVPDDNPADASIARGAVPYDEIAPRLNSLMAASDRISVQVVGQSVLGRDIHLVTITAPETAAETAQQAEWRDEIKHDAAGAASDDALMAGYKVPIWFNANIHGNEWEGTDGVLPYIEHLATAPIEEVADVLDGYRLYFTVTNNPDGRALGQRANGDGFDANRDMITGVTPEARIIRDLSGVIQPTFYVDLHGYTNVLQIEPCGPPHGENYEYDLFLPHAYEAALAIEEAVVDANIPGNTYLTENGSATTTNTGKVKIPYRDIRSGWDDWPPIFTPQFIAYQGAITNTVELPLGRTNNAAQNQANTLVNVAVAELVIETSVDYVVGNAEALLENQIEIFRRGDAGEELRTIAADADPTTIPGPDQWADIWDETDVYRAEFPRGYVIPMGAAQRSTTDAARLVDQLIANGVEVSRATAAFTIDGVEYPAGSYVVDMHQPLRGMANVLLDEGSDISERVPDMYDISAWSLALLWGADVVDVGSTTDAELPMPVEAIEEAAPTGAVPAEGAYLELATAGAAEYQAVNALLDAGVPVSEFEDGSVIVAGSSRDAAQVVADAYGVTFTASDGLRLREEPSRGLDRLTVAYSGTQDDRVTLQRLGFTDIRLVTAATITSGAVDLATADVLWVGGNLAFTGANAAGAAKVQEFLAAGKGVAGKGTAVAAFANAFGLTTVTATSGTSGSNGIVHVADAEGGLLASYTQDTAFVYPAVWYTGLGENAEVEQTYAGDDTFVAGHWADSAGRSTTDAAGQASVVTATAAGGARLAMLGTSVNFRTHPVGSYPSIARSLYWVAGEGAAVVGPVIEEDLTEETRGGVTLPDSVEAGKTAHVVVTGDHEGTAFQTVLFSTPVPLGTQTVVDGGFDVLIPADTAPGTHRLALVTESGELFGWDDFTVTAAVDGETPGGETPVETEAPTDGSGSGTAGSASGDGLADTGFPVALPLGIGAGVLLLGAAAVLFARRRRIGVSAE
ncbi:Zinc carboxypeptidase [Agromyces sp. CF514]|uniref:M14 family zinc carboxypeptidase n=1 Tax=Agromyces sp. CF514 TaxID=1881031 RepID=UPI0008E7D215|nr:M14 family zinc carboxypeptidase [Agromyces sp. CF514]SFR84385.1 Zinc carboxypeptidase [Agromyces sp. CF514]